MKKLLGVRRSTWLAFILLASIIILGLLVGCESKSGHFYYITSTPKELSTFVVVYDIANQIYRDTIIAHQFYSDNNSASFKVYDITTVKYGFGNNSFIIIKL